MTHQTVTPWACLALLLALVAAVVSPVFENGFVYDDMDVIVRSDAIHDPGQIPNFFLHHAMYVSEAVADKALKVDTYRPVTLVSFVWDAAISGRSPASYHATNLLMHLLCVGLVFVFLRGLLGPPRWAFALFATALFALSPHPNTAQIWINGRSDLFCTFFGLFAMLVWRRALEPARESGSRALLLGCASLLWLLGLLSKEVLICAVPLLVIYPEAHPVPPVARVRRAGGLLIASAAYLVMRVLVLGAMRTHEDGAHLFRALSFLAPLEFEGLLGALYPRRLFLRFMVEEFSAMGVATLVAMAGMLGALVLALWKFRARAPLVVWGLAWFGACLSPVAVVSGILWPGFGRYLYLPSVGLAVAVAAFARWLWDAAPRIHRLLALGAAVYLGLLALTLSGWVATFQDEETLYLTTIERNPEGAHGYGWLGLARNARGDYEGAIGPLSVAYQRAHEVRYAQTLLRAFLQTHRYDAAHQLSLDAATRFSEGADNFHIDLLNSAHNRSPREAAFQVLECLRKNPGSAPCGDALRDLVLKHPRRAEHVAALRAQLERPELSAIRIQTAPLIDSLP